MKRALLGLAIGAIAFGGVYGVAESLNLTSDSLGAATTAVAACQSAPLNATYAPAYSASTPGYTNGTVTITGLAASCYSKPYRVTVAGAAGASLGEATGTTPASGSSFAITIAPSASAASITAISVVISG